MTTSAKTSRKSVVIARSRPCQSCVALEAGPLAVDLAALDRPAEDEHRVAVAVVGAAVAVLLHRPAELRHRDEHDVGHAIAEILRERGEAAREIIEAIGDLAGRRRLRWRGGPTGRAR